MNGKSIVSAVRKLLQDDAYDAATILQAANWFVFELANNNKLRIFESSAEISGSAGDTEIGFPEDQLWWIDIYVTVPQVYNLGDEFQEHKEFMRSHAGFASSARGAAHAWTQFGNSIRVAAPLLTDTTFQVDYVREPKEMKNENSKCEIPARYSELVARGTKARILEIEEDYDYAQQERDILDPLVTTFIRNEARGGGKTRPTIIGSGRRRNRFGGVPRLGE